MKPAYHNAVTATEKRLIGDLAATQSQIEWLMMLTVANLTGLSRETCQAILGSTKMATNADIWVRVVREEHPYPEAVEWAEYAFSEMAHLSRNRNDFLHTIFGFADEEDGTEGVLHFGHRGWNGEKGARRSAVRVRNFKPVELAGLKEAVKRAAYLSIAVAHVEWSAMPLVYGSPWLRRLGGPLPPPKGEWGPHKARARQPPPRSSRG